MSNRQNQERESELQPKRMLYALTKIGKLKTVSDIQVSKTLIEFTFKDHIVRFYPYSGWHTGKSIIDGRGIDNLLKQLV